MIGVSVPPTRREERRELPEPTRVVDVRGARIACADAGRGEPVLLVHCSSASGTEWRRLCAALDGAFRPIVPDQWSCGRSDPWHGRGPFTLAAEAEPILAVMDALRTPVHLVGHSYGGGVALHLARRRPGRIRSLTLVEPSAFHLLRGAGAAAQAWFEEIAAVAAAVSGALAAGDYRGGMARFVDYWSGPGAWQAMPPEARTRLVPRLAKVALDFRALFEEPARLADYAHLAMPTLLLCGERSPGPSRHIVAMLAGALSGARVERIPGAGHMSPLSHPDAVNAAILRHLRRTAGQGGEGRPRAA